MKWGMPLAIVLLLVTALSLVLPNAPYGALLSMDSLAYLSAAKNLAEGHGIVIPDHALTGSGFTPLTLWPPLYPTALAALHFLPNAQGLPLERLLPLWNALLLFVSLLIFWRIAVRSRMDILALVATLLFAILPAIQVVFLYTWSETLYIPLVLAGYFCLQHHLRQDSTHPNHWLAAAVTLFAASCYTRYAGIGFLPALLLSILLFSPADLKTKWRHALTALAGFILLMAPLLLHNLQVSGHLSGGERGVPEFRLGSDLVLLGKRLLLETLNIHPAVAVVLILALLATLVMAWRRPPSRLSRGTAQNDEEQQAILMPLIWVASYLGFLLLSRQLQHVDLDTRMIAVVLPLILLSGLTAYRWLRHRAGLAALIPGLVIIGALTTQALDTSTSIAASLKTNGNPGLVNDIAYPSLATDHALAPLRQVSQQLGFHQAEVLLTDHDRPLFLSHLFQTTVLSLPFPTPPGDTAIMSSLLRKHGWIFVTTPSHMDAIIDCFKGRTRIYKLNGVLGADPVLLIQLPASNASCALLASL